MAEKEIKVAIIRKTNNLENDDRIRKEIGTLTTLFPHVRFKVFLMNGDNTAEESVTSYGLPYKAVHLKSRDKYPGGSHLFIKSWEYYQCLKADLKDYDFVWNSGDEPTPTLLFIREEADLGPAGVADVPAGERSEKAPAEALVPEMLPAAPCQPVSYRLFEETRPDR